MFLVVVDCISSLGSVKAESSTSAAYASQLHPQTAEGRAEERANLGSKQGIGVVN